MCLELERFGFRHFFSIRNFITGEIMDDINMVSQTDEMNMRRGLVGTGWFTVIIGVAAILLPFIATLTIQAIIAIVLIIAGVTHLIHAFQVHKAKGMVLGILGGLLYGAAGLLLIFFPMRGALSLTVLLAILFLFSGVFKILLAMQIRGQMNWDWLMYSGFFSILLGIIIWLSLPEAARWAIGLLVGIELIFSGISMLMIARAINKQSQV